jgi:type I restriction system adenine methylase HsdM
MADNKKEQERAELHRMIWNIANDLRGSVDGWDFKQYVLGMLFYRYISENITAYINAGEHEAGDATFNYAVLSDSDAEQAREDLVKTKGFFILPSELFENVRRMAPGDENLNETLESVFRSIESSALGSASEDNFRGLFDDLDVNSNKLGGTVAERNKRLIKLMNGVVDMHLGDYQDNTIDAFGDAYEFLMGMYASHAGKSGGEYYTPQEVSELLTHITLVGKTEVNKVYERFHSGHMQSRDFISAQEFQNIVAEVLNRNNDVYKYEFFNMAVQITLYSRSKKSKWNTFLDFNDNGRITGKYTYTQGYEGAAQPWSIGNEISRRIKSALYD